MRLWGDMGRHERSIRAGDLWLAGASYGGGRRWLLAPCAAGGESFAEVMAVAVSPRRRRDRRTCLLIACMVASSIQRLRSGDAGAKAESDHHPDPPSPRRATPGVDDLSADPRNQPRGDSAAAARQLLDLRHPVDPRAALVFAEAPK